MSSNRLKPFLVARLSCFGFKAGDEKDLKNACEEKAGVYVGVDTIVINFRHQTGVVAAEVLVFDGPLVVSGYAAHLAG